MEGNVCLQYYLWNEVAWSGHAAAELRTRSGSHTLQHCVRWQFSTAFSQYQDINLFPLTHPFCNSVVSCACSSANFLPSTSLLCSFYFRRQEVCPCFGNRELLRAQKKVLTPNTLYFPKPYIFFLLQ